MKKILCILALAILASCNGWASSTVVTPQNAGSWELNELNQEGWEIFNEDSQVWQESVWDDGIEVILADESMYGDFELYDVSDEQDVTTIRNKEVMGENWEILLIRE
jgi:hypothetical protein